MIYLRLYYYLCFLMIPTISTSQLVEKTATFEVSLSHEECADILLDMNRFGDYHPLINRVTLDKKKENTYSVRERPFNWLPLNIFYKARIEKLDSFHIQFYITKLGWYKPVFEYTLSSIDQNTTKIKCRVSIAERGPGRNYLLKRMFQSQDELWKKAVAN